LKIWIRKIGKRKINTLRRPDSIEGGLEFSDLLAVGRGNGPGGLGVVVEVDDGALVLGGGGLADGQGAFDGEAFGADAGTAVVDIDGFAVADGGEVVDGDAGDDDGEVNAADGHADALPEPGRAAFFEIGEVAGIVDVSHRIQIREADREGDGVAVWSRIKCHGGKVGT